MSSSSTVVAFWTNLQPEIVLSIAELLVVADIIRIRAVCGSWAWALGKRSDKHSHPPPPSGNLSFCQPSPWLLLHSSASQDDGACTFFSIIENCFYTIPSLPQITGRELIESSQQGWLVTIDVHLNPSFLNPLTRHEFVLPSMRTIPMNDLPFTPQEARNTHDSFVKLIINIYLEKIIFTPSPQQGGIAVAIWHDGVNGITLPFASVGDKSWSLGPNLPLGPDHLQDVVYNEKDCKLYALSSSLDVFILEFTNHSLEVISKVARPMEELRNHKVNGYIFFSHGDLMQTNWYLSDHIYDFNSDGGDFDYQASSEFKIFRFDQDIHNLHEQHIHVCSCTSCWVPARDLGNQSLILGTKTCFSLNLGDGLKKNQVLYIDNMMQPQPTNSILQLGIFDLEKNEIEHFVPYDILLPGIPIPILFMPSLKLWD